MDGHQKLSGSMAAEPRSNGQMDIRPDIRVAGYSEILGIGLLPVPPWQFVTPPALLNMDKISMGAFMCIPWWVSHQ